VERFFGFLLFWLVFLFSFWSGAVCGGSGLVVVGVGDFFWCLLFVCFGFFFFFVRVRFDRRFC